MRNISNSAIQHYVGEEFDKEDIEQITLATIVFEDGRMGTTIHVNDTYIDFNEDVIFAENDMIELQKEIKELGSFIYKEYGIIAKVEMCLFDGMLEECVF